MISFKIVIPALNDESGWETTRWRVNKPESEVTYEMLVERLQKIIATPTSGYLVSWKDDSDECSIHNTEELQDAIQYFVSKNYSDRCVRLKAEPKDELDLSTALQMYGAKLLENEVPDCVQNSLNDSSEDSDSCILNAKKYPHLVIQSVSSVTIPPTSSLYKSASVEKDLSPHQKRLKSTNDLALHHEHSNRQFSPVSSSTSSATVNAQDREATKIDVNELPGKLYMMGFRFHEDILKEAIHECKGDLFAVIDRLSIMRENQ